LLLSPLLYHGFRLFIGGLFLYAGATKLADTAGFGEAIAAYRILPDPLVPCAALGLPVFEVIASLGALLNRRWGILGITAMMILFLGVLSYGVAMGLDIDCGCFSPGKNAVEKPAEPPPLLEISPEDGSGFDSTVVLIDPEPAANADEGICSEENRDPWKLRWALIRDFFLFLGVLYLVFWQDLRKRNGLSV
jgi:hypothetical protein